MPIPCNKLTLEVAAPVNGIIVNPGFHTEYSGRDWDQFESRYFQPLTNAEEAKLTGKEREEREAILRLNKDNLWAEKKSGAIILRPNIEPIDMEMRSATAVGGGTYFTGPSFSAVVSGATRDWYKAYGGEWKNVVIEGNPKAQVLFQNTVQIPVTGGYIACPWQIITTPVFKENQGVTVWMGKNTLPANEEDTFVLHLTSDGGKSGIYVEIKSGKALRMAHYIDFADAVKNKTYPRKTAQKVQWTIEDLPTPKAVYDWPDPYTVYTLFICGRWIFFGVNGLEQAIGMECQNYDLNASGEPIILREDAALYLEGKGQVGIGFKKMVYAAEGRVETPLEFPGYKLIDSIAGPQMEAASYVMPSGTDIALKGYCTGAAKAGGGAQLGPLGSTDETQGAYGAVELRGTRLGVLQGAVAGWGYQSPYDWIDFNGYRHLYITASNTYQIIDTLSAVARMERTVNAYLSRVSEVTPTLFRFKLYDRLTRESGSVTNPTAPASGDCLYFNHGWNVDGEGVFLGAFSTLGVMSEYGLNYQDWLEAHAPDVDITMQHREAATGLKILRHRIKKTGFYVQNFGDHTLEIQGFDLVRILSNRSLKETRSYDDKNWTYAQLMTELCYLFGVTIHIATGVGTGLLPKSPDANSPFWTFTPGTKQWDALNRLRKRWGGILYPDENGELQWKLKPTSASTADYIFSRSDSLGQDSKILEPKIEVEDNWKTRIFIVGRAGQTVVATGGYPGHQKGDKLVGAWYHKTLEGKLGRTEEHVEIDDSLADWVSIGKRGDEIFLVSTSPGTYLKLKIPETLNGAQDCRKITPFQVIQWQDDLLTKYHNKKFLITSLAAKNNKFHAEAEIEGQMLA